MTGKRLLVLFVFLFGFSTAKCSFKREWRELYYAAYESKSAAEEFYRVTSHATVENPKAFAYRAVAEIMMCRYLWNPYTKLKYFRSGTNKLENAIRLRDSDIEIRYLRFCVQNNAPRLLSYYENLADDKALLRRYLEDSENLSSDEDLYRRIANCLNMR